MTDTALGLWGVPVAIIAGAIRVSTPFLFVSLGECLTERSGRINLGLEGTLVIGAMTGYGIALITGSPWLGVLAAGLAGSVTGIVHGLACGLPRVNHIALGIAMMLLGTGLAFYLGKPFIQPKAPILPSLEVLFWIDNEQVRSAFRINSLFIIGVVLAPVILWGLKNTRVGLIIRMTGDSSDAARAMGYSVRMVRALTTTAGGFLGGIGGAYLSLYYPGSWNERLSSGQGLMAVALVIFARWDPLNCLYASLLFGGAGALGPALQSVGVSEGYYLFYAAPYVLTLAILIYTSSSKRSIPGAPSELAVGQPGQ